MSGLRQLSQALAAAQTTSTALVEKALERARLSKSVFTAINPGLVNLAYTIDRGRRRNAAAQPLAGIPIALKDLFNVRNERTFAGSVVMKHYAERETHDADVVAPLRAAGLLFFGRTNMSEFAFSGIGRNPHYGTPLSIWDRATGRLPGGSSSGSAVAVAEGVVPAALGSDTAGSCRIPAAFNGIVGVKPRHGRLSLRGVYPLSPTLDAPGPLAVDVDSCFLLDRLMHGELAADGELPRLRPLASAELRLVVPEAIEMRDLAAEVQKTFEAALQRLEAAGARIATASLPVLDHCDEFFRQRPVVVREVWLHHRQMLAQHGDEYDPFVSQRIAAGADIDDDEQQRRYRERDEIVADFNRAWSELDADALVYPTVACLPPPLAATDDDAEARRINLNCLRNTATVNYFDGCAISLPCHDRGEAPVGLMLASRHGDDERLYAIAAAVEAILSGRPAP